MLATKGPIAIITLVYRGVSWGLIVLLESLRTAEPTFEKLMAAKGPVAIIALVC